MKKSTYIKQNNKKHTKVFYKDIYKNNYRLIFTNIRHTIIKNYDGAKLDPKQLTKMRKVIEIIKEFETNELDIIFTNYMKLFKVPYNNTMYYVVPKDCPVTKFRWAINKYNSIINNNEVRKYEDKIIDIRNNKIKKDKTFLKYIIGNKSDSSNYKNLVTLKNHSLNLSEAFKPKMNLIEIPKYKLNTSVKNLSSHFTIGNINPSNKFTKITIKKRNQSITHQLKELYKNRCQLCNKQLDIGNNEFYSEVHHIKPLGKHNGPDIIENMIVLCPNHHIMFDKGAITLDLNKHTVFHINKNHKINGKTITLKHSIDEQYINYYNLHIYKNKIDQDIENTFVDYEDTVIFFDGEELTEVKLENYNNRFLMNNMQRMLLYKKINEKFLFNKNHYKVIEIKKGQNKK